MIRFKEYLQMEEITIAKLKEVEKFADRLFAKVGVDIDLSSKHFMERLNDSRNGKEINSAELIKLFRGTFKKHGKKIGKMNPGIEGVVKELNKDLNLPFMIKYDKKNDELDFVAKTIMRKKNFKTSNKVLKV